MTTYTPLSDATLAQDKPLTQSTARAFRDNPLAIAEGSSGAPAISNVNPGDVQTASSSATLTFINLPAKDLIEFEMISLKPATAGAVLHCQVSINNGSSWIANYIYAKHIVEVIPAGSVSDVNEGAYGDTKITVSQVSGGVNNTGGNCLAGIFKLYSAGSTTLLKLCDWRATHTNNSTSGICHVSGGCHIAGVTSAQPINAVKFFFSSGNITNGSVAMRARRNTVTN